MCVYVHASMHACVMEVGEGRFAQLHTNIQSYISNDTLAEN